MTTIRHSWRLWNLLKEELLVRLVWNAAKDVMLWCDIRNIDDAFFPQFDHEKCITFYGSTSSFAIFIINQKVSWLLSYIMKKRRRLKHICIRIRLNTQYQTGNRTLYIDSSCHTQSNVHESQKKKLIKTWKLFHESFKFLYYEMYDEWNENSCHSVRRDDKKTLKAFVSNVRVTQLLVQYSYTGKQEEQKRWFLTYMSKNDRNEQRQKRVPSWMFSELFFFYTCFVDENWW